MSVVDDLVAWLIGLLGDAGRKKLIAWTLGDEQERAVRPAAAEAVRITAAELCPDGGRAEQLVMAIEQVFAEPRPDLSRGLPASVLEALQTGVAGQVAVLDDASLTDTGQSPADILGVPAGVIAEHLAVHLMREIVVRGSRGGPLEPLAAQLNHDMTHQQGRRLDGMVQEILSRLDATPPRRPTVLEVTYSLPPDAVAFTGREEELSQIASAVASAAGMGGVVAIHAIDGMPGVGRRLWPCMRLIFCVAGSRTGSCS